MVNCLRDLKFTFRRLRYRFAGATLTSKVKNIDGGVVSEEAFYENAELVGYYAYGYYDPSMPYVGQEKVKVKCSVL